MLADRAAIVPLGDTAMLVRFGDTLSDAANRRAVGFAERLSAAPPNGVLEITPSLVSVQLRLAEGVDFARLAAEISLLTAEATAPRAGVRHAVSIAYDGEDLDEVAAQCGHDRSGFLAAHAATPLRVLAVGFAPGFVYCGFHEAALVIPRRQEVRASVPAGTVLFAAGQTAIAATPIRTGWHIIGHTPLRNFDPSRTPPTTLSAGDMIDFVLQ